MECKEELIDFSCYEVFKDGTIFSKHLGKITKTPVTPNGYVYNTYKRKDGSLRYYYRHRVIWFFFNGVISKGMEIDHINGDKTDNRLENLRCVSRKENLNNPVTIEKMKIVVWGNQERNKKIAAGNTGKKHSEESKKKQSLAMSGEKHPNWGKKNPIHSARMKKAPRDKFGRFIKKES